MNLLTNDYATALDKWDAKEGYNIPHFPVYRENSSTTPVRPVFNASASSKGAQSLNKLNLKGFPEQTQLVAILLRSRLYRHLVLTDIKKSFLKIEVRPYLRFIWFKDDKLRVFKMKSLLFGAAASPFILHAIIDHLFHHYGSDVRETVNNIYMDDLVFMGDDREKLREHIKRVSQIMALANFDLHKWRLKN